MKCLNLIIIAFLILIFISPLAYANSSTETVTHYLHYASSVGTVNTVDTKHRIMNTTTSWSGTTQTCSNETNTVGTNYVYWYFYVYPTLAGSLTIAGTPAATLYLKANASVSDLTFVTTINKISTSGSRTQISTKSTGSFSLSTSYAVKTNTHGSASATVSSGYMLELNVTLGGSATANLTLTLAYDTNTYKSKLTLPCTDPVTVSLTSTKSVYEWEETMSLTVTVTDVWGGYDIASTPTITFSVPTGLSYTPTASSTGDTQYTNTYTYTYGGVSWPGGPGTWQATSSTSDNSDNSYTSSTLSFILRESGGVGPDPEPYQWTPSEGNETVIVVIIIIVIAMIIIASRKGKKRR